MTENMMKSDTAYNVLASIQDAMPVIDVDGKKVGKVISVYFGDQHEMTQIARPVEFYNLPPGMQIRLARDGFVQVDCGFFARDCLVTPEEIDEITDREIRLKVSRDSLYKL